MELTDEEKLKELQQAAQRRLARWERSRKILQAFGVVFFVLGLFTLYLMASSIESGTSTLAFDVVALLTTLIWFALSIVAWRGR
jgi:succinate-acetate transporter protein